MCAWKYKQLMPKLIVSKLKLLKPNQVLALVDMSIHHISSFLENNSQYKTGISEVNKKGLSAILLEDALLQSFIKIFEDFIKISPKDVRLLLSALLLKFEVNCVKTLLRAKEAKLSVEEAMNYILPLGTFSKERCRTILETSENISDVIDALSDLEYGLVLEKAITTYQKEKAFYLLEIALDRHVYQKIWRATGQFWGLDKKIARTTIGLEIDSLNIKAILQCKAIGIDSNQIMQYLIPGSDVLCETELQNAIKCPDIQTTISSMVESAKKARARDHRIIFKELESNASSLTSVETILDRGLLETNLRMMKRYTPYFNIGLLLAFLNLKWIEIKNLRAIVHGTESGIAPDRVRKLLLLPR